MSLATAIMIATSEVVPPGSTPIAVADRHPSDRINHERGGLVIRTAIGVECLQVTGSIRRLPKNWRKLVNWRKWELVE